MFNIRSRKLLSDKLSDDPFVVQDDEKYQKKRNAFQYNQQSQIQDHMRVTLLTCAGLYLRMMKLGYPSFVTEIELEITRQVNWYMAGKFFIGKFPPLMGILSTGLSRLTGYYGTEDLIYAGQPVEDFPIVALRRVSALLGSSLAPLCYLTLRNMGHSRSTATLASILLVFENGMVTQSRFASPEIFVMFFSALATFSWSTSHKLIQESQNIITSQAALWQIIAGVGMGCAIGSKWTGLLVYPIIWIAVLMDAWSKLCEKQNNVKSVLKQFTAALLTVGVLPLCIYLSIFRFHFTLIPKAGDHDLLLSSKLKYSLEGNELEPSQANIAFGSQIVIRHVGTVGGYLHSHKKFFTGGSKQQEVTLYPHVDINNIWTVHKNNIIWNNTQPIKEVHNRDQIRLEHFASSRKLHSHDHRPQLTNKKEHSEVTAYGDRLIQDNHDFWTLIILNDDGTPNKDKSVAWKPLTQKFRLQHVRGCMLISHNAYFTTAAGENHQEVTCMSSAGTHLSPWIVESAYHEKLENGPTVMHDKVTMFEMLKEVHNSMFQYPQVVYNRLQTGLINDGRANPQYYTEETPSKWFFKKSSFKVWSQLSGFSSYFILNSVIQKCIAACILSYIGYVGIYAFVCQRQMKLPSVLAHFDGLLSDYYTKSILYFTATVMIQLKCLSAIPSYVVSMPDISGTIYYGVGLIAVFFEACTWRTYPAVRRVAMYGLLIACLFKYSEFSHLVYGTEQWNRADCEKSGFDIDCIRFPAKLVETDSNATMTTVYVELAGSRTEPFKYNAGDEQEADRKIALLKKKSFEKEAKAATGALRYHRVMPTPALTPEEAASWAQAVYEGAVKRHLEAQKKKEQEAKEKKAEGSDKPSATKKSSKKKQKQ